MNAPAPRNSVPFLIGSPFEGGFFGGIFNCNGQLYALIVAPKSAGETTSPWIDDYQAVPGASTYDDGKANTQAMAEAGSALAKWAQGLDIEGHADWYLPGQDELEIIYRNLKPTTQENWQYGRSGINLSAPEPTRPYTPDSPVQTSAIAFQAGGEQAFEPKWYWSSTQHAANSDYAWFQDFHDGYQNSNTTNVKLRARAVRRLAIS
jgi:hypothetical protein